MRLFLSRNTLSLKHGFNVSYVLSAVALSRLKSSETSERKTGMLTINKSYYTELLQVYFEQNYTDIIV